MCNRRGSVWRRYFRHGTSEQNSKELRNEPHSESGENRAPAKEIPHGYSEARVSAVFDE